MTSGQTVVDGRFELLARLGSGGMGTVWRARDLALQREVALKEVRPGGDVPSDDPAMVAMFRERVLREARALARIDHPHVVTIHHIIDSPEMQYPWLVMELVRGESLQDRLDRGPLQPAVAATIGRGLLAALRAAHQAGICHRDIKPANVLLRTDGSPVLTDFGIAVLGEASRVTVTGGLVGSPEYIAPERLHGHEGDPASDLWSLGMLLYVAVEGHNPMRRTTLAATLAAVMTAQIPPPRQAGPLAEAIGALLQPRPETRPTPDQLDHMLARAETQPTVASHAAPFPGHHHGPPPVPFPGAAPPPTFPSAAAPPPPRRRGFPALLLAPVAIAAVGALIFVVANSSLNPFSTDTVRDPYDAYQTAPGYLPTPSQQNSVKASPQNVQQGKLLTPAGINQVIGAFEKATGTDRFAGFTVYEEYAYAEVPVPGRSKAVDRYLYKNGQVSKMGGGTSSGGGLTVSLRAFNWSAVPGLLRTADKKLNVPKPTNRYLIVAPGWTFANGKAVMLIYLTDDYGSGYLVADTKGKVLKFYAAE